MPLDPAVAALQLSTALVPLAVTDRPAGAAGAVTIDSESKLVLAALVE